MAEGERIPEYYLGASERMARRFPPETVEGHEKKCFSDDQESENQTWTRIRADWVISSVCHRSLTTDDDRRRRAVRHRLSSILEEIAPTP